MMQSFLSVFSPFKLLVLSLGIFLQACTQAPPETVAGDFWAAALTGDRERVVALSAPEHFSIERFDSAHYQQLFDRVNIGELESGSREARIATRLEGYLASIDFDTILLRQGRHWRVDYSATTREMIASVLDSTVSATDLQIQEDIRVLDRALDDAILKDWRELDRQLKKE